MRRAKQLAAAIKYTGDLSHRRCEQASFHNHRICRAQRIHQRRFTVSAWSVAQTVQPRQPFFAIAALKQTQQRGTKIDLLKAQNPSRR